MSTFYDEDWYCATHNHKWARANDEFTTPRHCPKSEAWLEDYPRERCEISTIGDAEAGEAANRHDDDLEDRRLEL